MNRKYLIDSPFGVDVDICITDRVNSLFSVHIDIWVTDRVDSLVGVDVDICVTESRLTICCRC